MAKKETLWLDVARLKDRQKRVSEAAHRHSDAFWWTSLFITAASLLLTLSLASSRLRFAVWIIYAFLMLGLGFYNMETLTPLRSRLNHLGKEIEQKYDQIAKPDVASSRIIK